MNKFQENKCHAIIHSHAAACAAGNAVPVPGCGFAVDAVAMASMCMALAAVFGASVTEQVAKGMAIAALKKAVLKHPLKYVAKELAKFVPFLGQMVAPAVSAVMIESAGWMLVAELERKAAGQAAD